MQLREGFDDAKACCPGGWKSRSLSLRIGQQLPFDDYRIRLQNRRPLELAAQMSFSAGTKLGRYEIRTQIGAGGN